MKSYDKQCRADRLARHARPQGPGKFTVIDERALYRYAVKKFGPERASLLLPYKRKPSQDVLEKLLTLKLADITPELPGSIVTQDSHGQPYTPERHRRKDGKLTASKRGKADDVKPEDNATARWTQRRIDRDVIVIESPEPGHEVSEGISLEDYDAVMSAVEEIMALDSDDLNTVIALSAKYGELGEAVAGIAGRELLYRSLAQDAALIVQDVAQLRDMAAARNDFGMAGQLNEQVCAVATAGKALAKLEANEVTERYEAAGRLVRQVELARSALETGRDKAKARLATC